MKKANTLLLMPLAFVMFNNSWADNAGDSHTVSVTVPQVALLDIQDQGVDAPYFELRLPTDAGTGFTGALDGTKTKGDKPYVAITSNLPNAVLCAQSLVNNQALASVNLQLTIQDQSGFTTGFSVPFNTQTIDTYLTDIGNVVTGILPNEGTPATDYRLRLTPAVSGTSPIPPYGNHSITVTYTLKDGSC